MNRMDKIFRDRLDHHTQNIPTGLWDKVEAQLNEDPRPNKFWASFGLTLAGISMLFSVVFFLTHEFSKEVIKDEIQPLIIAGNSEFSEKALCIQIDKNKEKLPDAGFALVGLADRSNRMTLNARKIKSTSKRSNSSVSSIIEASSSSVDNPLSVGKSLVLENESEMARSVLDIAYISTIKLPSKLKIYNAIKIPALFGDNTIAKSCPFVQTSNDLSVDAYVSHDFAHRNLSLVQGVEASSYMDMRNQTEKSLYSFSAGLRFGYNIGYRWNLHTGLNYSQINEKFEYVDPESNQTRIIIIKDYIYQGGKIVDSTIMEELISVPGTAKLKVYNKFKTLDIPVLARFTLAANHRFSLSAMAGVFVNLKMSQRGMFLSPDESTPVEFTSGTPGSEEIFKTQLGVSGYTGLSLAYHLTKNIDFLVEPNARFQTESMTFGDFPTQQRYNTFGFGTGLRYKF